MYEAHFNIYRALFRIYRVLFRLCRALFRIHRALLKRFIRNLTPFGVHMARFGIYSAVLRNYIALSRIRRTLFRICRAFLMSYTEEAIEREQIVVVLFAVCDAHLHRHRRTSTPAHSDYTLRNILHNGIHHIIYVHMGINHMMIYSMWCIPACTYKMYDAYQHRRRRTNTLAHSEYTLRYTSHMWWILMCALNVGVYYNFDVRIIWVCDVYLNVNFECAIVFVRLCLCRYTSHILYVHICSMWCIA